MVLLHRMGGRFELVAARSKFDAARQGRPRTTVAQSQIPIVSIKVDGRAPGYSGCIGKETAPSEHA
ncbi:hypothetical protein AB4144_16915, partial [Rhizobiaceae sp. 2RAB30]